MKNLLMWDQILSWYLLVIVIESFAMGTDIVLVFACNSGCMPESCTDLLFSCRDVFGLRLCASCCLTSTVVYRDETSFVHCNIQVFLYVLRGLVLKDQWSVYSVLALVHATLLTESQVRFVFAAN